MTWDAWQQVEVVATLNQIADVDENLLLFHNTSSSDPRWDSALVGTSLFIPSNLVLVDIYDAEDGGISISGSLISVTEGSASNSTYTISLDTRPTSPVTVTLTAATAVFEDISFSPRTLYFDPAVDVGTDATVAWNSPRTIQVQAVVDEVLEGMETF